MSIIMVSSPLDEKKQVQQWDELFDELIEFIGPRFSRSEAHERARDYLQGLLSSIERKNGWQLAEKAGASNPYGIQNLLGRAVWSANGLRDDLMTYVKAHLVTPDGVGVIDETGFLKKGIKSAGVQRQYSGTAGKVENCQIGVFLTYVSEKGRTFLDRELYLPESWINDPNRCRRAGVPEETEFATKPALAQQMIERASESGIIFSWITGDAVYGNNPGLRNYLEQKHQPYVLAIACSETVTIEGLAMKASEGVEEISQAEWKRLSAGNGTKGPRIYDWARMKLDENAPEGWSQWLLFRRSLKDPEEIAYFRVFALSDCTLDEMVRVAGARWSIEECFETSKGEVGLDQYEVRSWTGWYRHITLACLAHAFLTIIRSESVINTSKKKRWRESTPTALNSSLAEFKLQRGL